MHRRSAVAEAALAADGAVVDGPRDINHRRLRAAAVMDRPCRDRNPSPVVQARQERIAPAAPPVARLARRLEIDPLRAPIGRLQREVPLRQIVVPPVINAQAQRVKQARNDRPTSLKLLVGARSLEPVIGRVRAAGRLLRNWMISWEISRAAGPVMTLAWLPTLGQEPAIVVRMLPHKIARQLLTIARTLEIAIGRILTTARLDRATSTSAMSTLETQLTTRRTGKPGWTIAMPPPTGSG
jgi:hypothetical protein